MRTNINGITRVKIADFGCSATITSMNERTTRCGTKGFVAPEIWSGYPYNEKVDIWSLGRLLIQLAEGDYNQELSDKWSDDFKSFVECCLKVEPADRWSSIQLKNVLFFMFLNHSIPLLNQPLHTSKIKRLFPCSTFRSCQ